MTRQTVLNLFESDGNPPIDPVKLPPELAGKVRQLDSLLILLDQLKRETEFLNKRRRDCRLIFLGSLVPAALGLLLGAAGLILGYLGSLQAVVSVSAATGLVIVDFYVAQYVRKASAKYLQKSAAVEGLTTDLNERLGELHAELYPEPPPPALAKPAARVRKHARGEGKSV